MTFMQVERVLYDIVTGFLAWIMIDYCRGYAYIVFVKSLLGEERAQVHESLKKIVDKQITSTCR